MPKKRPADCWDFSIDVGLTTGWAIVNLRTREVLSGVWDFKDKRGDGSGMRFLRLQAKLDEIHGSFRLRRIVYELPGGHFKSGAAAQSILGMVSHVQSWAEKKGIPCEGFSQTQIKAHALHGKASKDEMIEEAKKRWPTQDIKTHDQADALFILDLGLTSLDGTGI